jgi:hypothetical protein
MLKLTSAWRCRTSSPASEDPGLGREAVAVTGLLAELDLRSDPPIQMILARGDFEAGL